MKKNRVIVYDEGAGLEAARAYVTFDYLGMGDRTALLDGQWRKWRTEGRPVLTAAPTVTPSNFTPRVRPDVIVSLQEMRDLVKSGKGKSGAPVALIDARPEAQFSGKEAGEGVSRAGHIPGATNVYWMQHVAGADDPVLRPADALRALYSKAGAKPGGQVVTYCRSGVQASHSYFTAKYLGYDTRLYDGSFLEWSAAKDAPVETGSAPK